MLYLRLLCLAAVCFVAGCVSPAHPIRERAETAAPANVISAAAPLNGTYDVTFHSNWFGPLRTTMTAQALPDEKGVRRFKANTRPGIAWDMVGGVEAVVGQLLAPYIFPNGMLLVWESTMPDANGEHPGEGWIGISTVGEYRARTRMKTPNGPVEIVFTDGRVISAMTFTRHETEIPKVDFVALSDRIEAHTKATLFDPGIAADKEFRAYFADLRATAAKTRDDVEFTFAGGLTWRKHSDLPLPLAYRPVGEESERLMRAATGSVRPLTLTFDSVTRIATIEALTFTSAAEVDEVFAKAMALDPVGIVLDLRSCTGYDLAALRALSFLSESEVDAGLFFGSSLRAKVESGENVEAPTCLIASASDVEAAHATLAQARGLRVRVAPQSKPFRGPVAVLTLSRTRSSAEVLAALLKARPNTRFFGGKTAGRPRLTFERDLGQGYVIRVPEFDWINAKGERLKEGAGVIPDVRCGKESAPKRAINWIAPGQSHPPGDIPLLQ